MTGTSMATPHVAGAVALIKQAHPDWTPDEIKHALRMTATETGTERGHDYNVKGYGQINVLKAIELDSRPPIAYIDRITYSTNSIRVYGTAKADAF